MSQVSGIPLHFKNTCVRSTLQSFAIFSSETLSWISLRFRPQFLWLQRKEIFLLYFLFYFGMLTNVFMFTFTWFFLKKGTVLI